MPSVSSVRPPRCLGCGVASRPLGKKLVVHGDGTRERQVWGPAGSDVPSMLTAIDARRYECQRCGACMLVVPRELLPRRRYTASAIAMALALWALLGATEAAVRARVSPYAIVGDAAIDSWVTLRRWTRDTATGRLFSSSRPPPPASFTLRQHAERAAAALAALAPGTGMRVDEAAFAGAVHHRP